MNISISINKNWVKNKKIKFNKKNPTKMQQKAFNAGPQHVHNVAAFWLWSRKNVSTLFLCRACTIIIYHRIPRIKIWQLSKNILCTIFSLTICSISSKSVVAFPSSVFNDNEDVYGTKKCNVMWFFFIKMFVLFCNIYLSFCSLSFVSNIYFHFNSVRLFFFFLRSYLNSW